MRKFFSLLSASDNRLFLLINERCHCTLLDMLLSKLTHLGGAFFTLFICLFLILIDLQTTRTAALEALIAVFLGQILVQILKRKIGRERPYFVFEDINMREPLFDFSFPSGHTTAGYSLAVVFAVNYPMISVPLLSLAALIGFSRTYLGFHYPLDVVMGGFIGWSAAHLVCFFSFVA